jgi:hypothetical protein
MLEIVTTLLDVTCSSMDCLSFLAGMAVVVDYVVLYCKMRLGYESACCSMFSVVQFNRMDVSDEESDQELRAAGHMVPADQSYWAYVLVNSVTSSSPDNCVCYRI